MSTTYVAVDAVRGRIEYTDRKRHWWLLSVVWPLIPFTGIAARSPDGRRCR